MPIQEFTGELDAPTVAEFSGETDQEKEAREKSSSSMRRVSDVGISGLKSMIAVPELAVGLADLATGGYAGKLAEDAGFRPKEAKAFLDEYLSPQQQAANKALADTKGFLATIGKAVEYPSTILHSAVESLAPMGAGGVAARGLMKAAGAAPWAAGAIGEGAAGMGLAAETVRQESPDRLLDAKQTFSAVGSGLGTAAFGAAGGKLAQKLKIADIDTMIAQGSLKAPAGASAKGFARRLAEGAVSEGVFEELPQSLQEQMWQNYATDKPIMDGVPEAGAMGMLTGAVMGGPAAALGGKPTEAPPKPNLSPREELLHKTAESVIAKARADELITKPTKETQDDKQIANPAASEAPADANEAGAEENTKETDESILNKPDLGVIAPNLGTPSLVGDNATLAPNGDISASAETAPKTVGGIPVSAQPDGQSQAIPATPQEAAAATTEHLEAARNLTRSPVKQAVIDQELQSRIANRDNSQVSAAPIAPTPSTIAPDNVSQLPQNEPIRATNETIAPNSTIKESSKSTAKPVEAPTAAQPAIPAATTPKVENAAQAGVSQVLPPKVGQSDATITKGGLNSLSSNAKFFSRLSQSDAFRDRGLDGIDIPTQRLVMSRVIAALHQPEIVDFVVKTIPVDVVNNLIRAKGSPKVLLHNKDVSLAFSSVNTDGAVSLRRDIADALVVRIANFGAEQSLGTSQTVRGAQDGRPTIGALGSDLRGVKQSSTRAGTEKSSTTVLSNESGFPEYGISADIARKIGFGVDIGHDASPSVIIERLANFTGKSKSEVLADYPDLKQPEPAKEAAKAPTLAGKPITEASDRILKAAENGKQAEAVKAERERRAAVAQEAQHVESGESEEATPEVIRESVAESAANTPMDFRQARDKLLIEIDAAIKQAPQRVEERKRSYVRFDVPGDGTFKVLNLSENLQKFRKSVAREAGFRPLPKKRKERLPAWKRRTPGDPARLKELEAEHSDAAFEAAEKADAEAAPAAEKAPIAAEKAADNPITAAVTALQGAVNDLAKAVNPEAAAKPVAAEQGGPGPERFEIGRKLTKDQRKEVLKSLGDVYRDNGLEKEVFVDARGEESWRYPYTPSLFVKSDITGAMVRHYVFMPDGKRAHPSELFPDFTQSRIDREIAQQEDEWKEKKRQAGYEANSAEKTQHGSLQESRDYWAKTSEESKKRSAGGWATILPPEQRTPFEQDGKYITTPTRDPLAIAELKRRGWTQTQWESVNPSAPATNQQESALNRSEATIIANRTINDIRAETHQKGVWIGDLYADGEPHPVRLVFKGTNRADYYFDLHTDGKVAESIPYPAISGKMTLAQAADELLAYLRTDSKQKWEFKNIGEKQARLAEAPEEPAATGKELPWDKTDLATLVELKTYTAKKYKTANDEKMIEILTARIHSDPTKWAVGDGVGYHVARQINRGFQIAEVDVENKMARIVQVSDTGLTSSGGDNDRIKPQWVHIAELVRDHKYDNPNKPTIVSGKQGSIPDKNIETRDTDKGTALFARRDITASDSKMSAAVTMLAEMHDFFQQPTPQEKTLTGIANEIDPGFRVERKSNLFAKTKNATNAWEISVPNSKYRGGEIFERGDKVWVNVSRLIPGVDTGNRLYGIAAAYAHNNGKVLVGDPEGLSRIAYYRRTENMLSSALKFGTTDHLAPHEAQTNPKDYYREQPNFAENTRAINWKPGETAHNLRELLMVSYTNAIRSIPELANVQYNFDKQRFESITTGQEFTSADFSALVQRGRGVAASSSIGSSTAKRAALLNTFLRGQGKTLWPEILAGISAQLSGRGLDSELRGTFYARAQGEPGGITASTLRAEISKAFGPKATAMVGDILIPLETQAQIADVSELADVVPLIREGDRISGFYHPATGKTYAILENLAPEGVKGLALHEIGVHYGMEGMLGKGRYAQLSRQLDAMRRAGNKAVIEAHEQAAKQAARPSQISEETIAYLVTNRPELPFVQRLIAQIKAFLFRKFGILGDRLTVDDITALARASVIHASEGVRNGEPQFMVAWHGSPHDFDEFSLHKIGTGEGAQAYGWGAYFASNKSVAEYYRNALTGGANAELNMLSATKDGKTLNGWNLLPEYFKPGRIVRSYGGWDEVISFNGDPIGRWDVTVKGVKDDLNGKTPRPPFDRPRKHATSPSTKEVMATLEKDGWTFAKAGKLYQVNLAPAEDEYLDWDKPLSEQSEKVRAALKVAIARMRDDMGPFGDESQLDLVRAFDVPKDTMKWRGFNLYQSLARYLGKAEKTNDHEAASKYLLSLGIPGIRYLDGSSRGKGEGNSNYVIFDDSLVKIEAKFNRSQDQTQTEAFRKWFGASKVVDAEGKPLVVYHGGRAENVFAAANGMNWFSENQAYADLFSGFSKGRTQPVYLALQNPFDATRYGDREVTLRTWRKILSRDGVPMEGVTLENWAPDAGKYYFYDLLPHAGNNDLAWSVKKGLLVALKEAGFDGIIAPSESNSGIDSGKTYVAFRPEQIKSAADNVGTFDPNNTDIRFARNVAQGGAGAWNPPNPSKLDNLIYTLQDKQVDTRRVLQAIREAGKQVGDTLDVYLQEELFHGRAAKETQDFIDGELKPLITEMAARKVTMAEFEEYLHARHAEEANIAIAGRNPNMPDGGSGMDTADAQAYLDTLDPAKKRAFEALAKRIDAINDATRQLLVDAELESQDTIDTWKAAYQHYVPLHREDMGGGPGIGQGFSVRGPASKMRTGSSRTVVDILGNIAIQREKAIVRAEKNVVSKALYGLAKANPNPDFWSLAKPGVTTSISAETGDPVDVIDMSYQGRDNVVMHRSLGKDGKIVQRGVEFDQHNERALRMAMALKNLDANEMGEILSASAKVTRYFASVNTQYNPIFGVVNLTRDSQQAMFNLSTTPIAGKQAEVAKHTLSALKGIYLDLRAERSGQQAISTWAQLFEEFQREGGKTGYRDMFRTGKDRAESLQRELARASEGKAKQFGRAVFDWLSDYNTAMENAVRLSAYKVGKESGMTNQRAASMAKNLTVNFNRKGQITTQAGSLYAFFNASVQGSTRLAETLNGPMGRKIIIGGITLGAVQALMLAAAGFDDDEPPQFIRERSTIIPIGDKKYITIPMPLGLHFIPNIGRIATEFALSGFRDPGKRVAGLFGVFADAFNPVGSAGLSLQTITPTVIDPLVALAENKDWTGKPIARVDMSSLAPTPGHVRAKDTASAFSKGVSQALNYASGGTNYKPGLFSPTPDQIDYLIGQATGGIGREAMKVEQSIGSVFTGEDLPTYKIPLVGRFYGDTAQQSSQGNTYYSNIKKLNEHEAEIKGRRKAGEPLGDYMKDNPEARLFQMANKVERDVSALRKQKRALIAKDANQDVIKAKDAQITARMKMLNDRVKQVSAQAQ